MNILFNKNVCVGFMVSKIHRVFVFGYFPLQIYDIRYMITLNGGCRRQPKLGT